MKCQQYLHVENESMLDVGNCESAYDEDTRAFEHKRQLNQFYIGPSTSQKGVFQWFKPVECGSHAVARMSWIFDISLGHSTYSFCSCCRVQINLMTFRSKKTKNCILWINVFGKFCAKNIEKKNRIRCDSCHLLFFEGKTEKISSLSWRKFIQKPFDSLETKEYSPKTLSLFFTIFGIARPFSQASS